MIYWILLYFLGCILAYILFKYYILLGKNRIWDKGDRTIGLMASIFSWVSVITLLTLVLDHDDYKNQNAKW